MKRVVMFFEREPRPTCVAEFTVVDDVPVMLARFTSEADTRKVGGRRRRRNYANHRRVYIDQYRAAWFVQSSSVASLTVTLFCLQIVPDEHWLASRLTLGKEIQAEITEEMNGD